MHTHRNAGDVICCRCWCTIPGGAVRISVGHHWSCQECEYEAQKSASNVGVCSR